MINNINQTGVDPNTLIPYADFNWECIDGMDCVYKDLLDTQGSIAKSIGKGITNNAAIVEGVNNGITNNIKENLDDIAATISDVNNNIGVNISSGLTANANVAGSGNGEYGAWVVFLEQTCGVVSPRVIVGYQPPATREYYGPYSNYPRINAVKGLVLGDKPIEQLTPGMPLANKSMLDAMYTDTNRWPASVLGSPDQVILSDSEYGNIQPQVEADCAVSTKPTISEPIVYKHFQGNCEQFRAYNWLLTDLRIPGENDIGSPAFVTEDGTYLWSHEHLNYTNLCNVAPTQVINNVPQSTGTTTEIPTYQPTTPTTSEPSKPTNQSYPPAPPITRLPTSVDKPELVDGNVPLQITQTCCDDIVNMLAQIRDRISPVGDKKDIIIDDDAVINDTPERKYELSIMMVNDTQEYLDREGIVVANPPQFASIGQYATYLINLTTDKEVVEADEE